MDDLRDTLINQVSELPVNLKQVAEKLPYIQRAKDLDFHASAATADLEEIRTALRGIMKYRRKDSIISPKPMYINVAEEESEYTTSEHKVKMKGLDLAAYRNRVEVVLNELFENNSALQKIKAGQPVEGEELESLVSEVLVMDPDLHLEELLVHFPNKSKNLALAIRQVIGMDAERVDEHFKSFVQDFPSLNSNQIRFLEMLKSYIARYGAIELEKLWDTPFTSIHSQGVDGVFTQSEQVDALLKLLEQLNEPAA